MKSPLIITGRAAVLVSKYMNFDPLRPEATSAHEFAFFREGAVNNGALVERLAADGFRHVGWADIKIELLQPQDMAENRVKALQEAKAQLLAQTQDIENQIASLLALPDTATMEVEP